MKLLSAVLCTSIMCLLFLTAGDDKAWAQEVVADQLFKKNCMKCHGPKPERFARQKLGLKDGILVGAKSNRRVEDVLIKHFGVRISPEQANTLIEALRQHM